jgi:hypothetical protein
MITSCLPIRPSVTGAGDMYVCSHMAYAAGSEDGLSGPHLQARAVGEVRLHRLRVVHRAVPHLHS